jgi:hypothetical protein
MRKSKSPKNNKSEGMSECNDTDGGKDINKNTSIEPTVAITRARRIGTDTLLSSQSSMQKIMRVKILSKALFTSENLQRTEKYLKESRVHF